MTSISGEDFQKKLTEETNSYQQILQQTHNEALFRNEIQIKRWQDYRKEHEELSNRLLSFRNTLTHTVMLPLGKKALMRGRLVHTNEILVSLGDGWFAKCSAKEATEICQRRIEHCDEMLIKLKKEEELLTSRKSFPFESDAFSSGPQAQEVIEPYDEESERQWRERHRQKEREYRQKLAELRKAQQNTKVETEQDLWSRLDALDLQEELEDEINRLNENDEDEVETDETEEYSSDSENELNDTGQQNDGEDVKIHSDSPLKPKRSVSFKEYKQGEEEGDEEGKYNEDNLIHILFKHSDEPSTISSMSDKLINSPADIYAHYLRNKQPKSILKPSPSNETAKSLKALDDPVSTRLVEDVRTVTDEVNSHQSITPLVKAVNEVVVERECSSTSMTNTERPVSRFKAARMASKR